MSKQERAHEHEVSLCNPQQEKELLDAELAASAQGEFCRWWSGRILARPSSAQRRSGRRAPTSFVWRENRVQRRPRNLGYRFL